MRRGGRLAEDGSFDRHPPLRLAVRFGGEYSARINMRRHRSEIVVIPRILLRQLIF